MKEIDFNQFICINRSYVYEVQAYVLENKEKLIEQIKTVYTDRDNLLSYNVIL